MDMGELDMLSRLLLALATGFLVGFQREFSFGADQPHPAGVRTFSLLGVFGFSGALFSLALESPWPLTAVLLGGCALAMGTYLSMRPSAPGITTEAAMVLTVATGALCGLGYLRLGVAVGLLTAVLLSAKSELHALARKVTRRELTGTIEFCVMCAVVLPLLPDRAYGPEPFDVFNPFTTCLLVVFVSGIGFVGFVLTRIAGPSKGIGLTGFLGGLVSSTALTLSFSRRAALAPSLARSFAFALILSWTVMYLRLLGVVAALRPDLAARLALPLCALGLAGAAMARVSWSRLRAAPSEERPGDTTMDNPFELGPALKFALLFTGILFASRLAQVTFGDAGLCATAFFSGLANVDAMALSVVELLNASEGSLPAEVAARAVLFGVFANTLSKGAIVALLGGRPLLRELLPALLAVSVVAAALLFVA